MELQQLRYVCAIADTGSFSRAAEQCQVAQPSLSQQILKLEDDLGARLFDRLGRGIRLTEAGRAFLPHARSILSQVENARSSVQERSADARGSVTVGVIPTIAPYLMPRYARSFASQYPQARLRIVEEKTPDLIEALRSLSIDLAILALPLRQKEFHLVPILTEPLYAVLPQDHPHAGARAVALRDLRAESFVMLRDGHCFRDLSISACSRARIAPRIAFESDQFSSVLGLVAAGIGVSIAPAMAIDPNAGCAYVPISDPRATRTIVAARLHGRSLNQVQQAFLAQISRRSARAGIKKRAPA
ncbi:MAG: LysR family transcriptional regulator [Acidobacteriaceae bacterium]